MEQSRLKQQALAVLKRFYGYDHFYPLQWQVISHVMQGRDAVVLMPTGGGKSLCYQIPALLSPGCAIVVSPLLALMNDQVDALRANGVPAAAVNSQQTDTQNRSIIENVFAGNIKLLYISPEKLLSELDMWSHEMKISLIAIDEAHCISQWGHDFRPEYTRLSVLKEHFPSVPVMALTATADRLTRDDIARQLGIADARLFLSSFDRPNISLQVRKNISGRAKLKEIANFIARRPGQSGIIYCLSRKNTETMAQRLQALGIHAMAYHAGMSNNERNAVQRAFINDEVPVICATIAFGMGIDKSNVRWVVHSNMPKSMECYYQEIGRAGRDGMPAEALMFYSLGDMVTLSKFARESGQSQTNIDKLRRMQQYAEATVCRRRILLSYFNESYETDCHNCDVCHNPPERIDGTRLSQMAMSAIARTHEQVGTMMVIDILRGSHKAELLMAGYDRLPTYGVGRHITFGEWNAYLLQMLQLGLIDVMYDEANHLHITPYGKDVLFGRATVMFSKYVKQLPAGSQSKKPAVRPVFAGQHTDEVDTALFEKLRNLRLAIARASHIPPYTVFSDKVLAVMAREKPTTQAEFGTLYGVGEAKTARYWRAFTSVIKQHINQNRPR